MIVAEAEPPPGFSLSRVEANRLAERHELLGRRLVLYIEGLKPGQKGIVPSYIRLRYRGSFTVRPIITCAYYMPELRGRTSLLKITIKVATPVILLGHIDPLNMDA